MKNSVHTIVVLFMCMLLGIFVSMQFKQNPDEILPVSLRSIEEKKQETHRLRTEIEDIKKRIKQRQAEIAYMETLVRGDDLENILIKEIEQLKTEGGLNPMSGKGIIMFLDDRNMEDETWGDPLEDIVHDTYLMTLINDLKTSDAEAISINGQRIIQSTPINCDANVIQINGRGIAPPYTIKAIGNPKELYAAMQAPYTNGYQLKHDYGLDIKVQLSDYILIPEYWKPLRMTYLKPKIKGD